VWCEYLFILLDRIVNVDQTYVRATRYILPSMFSALSKGNDPDRIKGALYVLGHKGTGVWFRFVFQRDLTRDSYKLR
jgi:hypothetical protein